MNERILKILQDYWGYQSFRPPQDEIIRSVMKGTDTLALMPTGGGKSICFQVPALAGDGITLVISPLIALMTDQVDNLKKRGIPAAKLVSGMSYKEIDLTLENAANGKFKLLYVSPERLKTELFTERLKRMKVDLIAVDEAHCISQWGFDFRPSYREISHLRDKLPDVPVLALTATATPKVRDDIVKQLRFRDPGIIRKSFLRPNLAYQVFQTERKWSDSLQALRETRDSAIVYMRSRKNCAEVAKWLVHNGVRATYYHAGLDSPTRKKRQDAWINNEYQVMVSTNAFGMGVDKPDVRLVVHLDIPDSLEAYFQEAGRAGRDGRQARSVIFIGPADEKDLIQRYLENFPDLGFIRRLYQALANHLQLAVGSGEMQAFDFDLPAFAREYQLPLMRCYQALQILEREGILSLNDSVGQASRVKLQVDRTTLYDFQLRNPALDGFIKTLTRSYGGLETEYAPISETLLARRHKSSKSRIVDILRHLKSHGILDYIETSGQSRITMILPRLKADKLNISDEHLKYRFKERQQRIDAVRYYINQQDTCRSILLLRYFGEESNRNCGICDVCARRSLTELNQKRFQLIRKHVTGKLAERKQISVQVISDELGFETPELLSVIDFMVDEGELIRLDDTLRLNLPGKKPQGDGP